MAFKMRGFTPFHNNHNPYGWTDLEYERSKKDTLDKLHKYKELSVTDPDGHTLDYGETEDDNSGATNKVKYNELVDYAKEINIKWPK
jgi:hypothetical protein